MPTIHEIEIVALSAVRNDGSLGGRVSRAFA